jgi:hypothetical protein
LYSISAIRCQGRAPPGSEEEIQLGEFGVTVTTNRCERGIPTVNHEPDLPVGHDLLLTPNLTAGWYDPPVASTSEQVLVSIVSGFVGGVLVMAARVGYDLWLERRSRRRGALEDLLKDLVPLKNRTFRFTVAGEPHWEGHWEGHEDWWPALFQQLNGLIDRWDSDWSLRIADPAHNNRARHVDAAGVAAEIANQAQDRTLFVRIYGELVGELEAWEKLTRRALGQKD